MGIKDKKKLISWGFTKILIFRGFIIKKQYIGGLPKKRGLDSLQI